MISCLVFSLWGVSVNAESQAQPPEPRLSRFGRELRKYMLVSTQVIVVHVFQRAELGKQQIGF